jgi:methylated-DNA-[protein]-cysteine S-methyltransferase
MMTVRETVVETPIGRLRVEAEGGVVVALRFEGPGEGRLRDGGGPADAAVLREAEAQLRAWFAGERDDFDLPIAPRGTPFQRAVWDALVAIPPGETRTYGAIARSLGRPSAARAVGAACGANPIGILVPCHRVVGADGGLTGFGWGLERKRWLIERERQAKRRSGQIRALRVPGPWEAPGIHPGRARGPFPS